MKGKVLSVSVLLGALAFIGYLHFSYLGWGLPSRERTFRTVGGEEELNRLVPVMVEQREKYYSLVNKMLDKTQPFQETYNQLFHRWDVQTQDVLPREIVMDRMRNYLVGANVSDEQFTMTALSAIRPRKLEFSPGPTAYYGGLYYYTAGAMLVLGKIARVLTLNPGVEYYFYHPEEIRKMYILMRALGGLSILGTCLLTFRLAVKAYGWAAGTLASLFFAATPLLVPLSHLTKAHLYGMFWMTVSLYFCFKIISSEKNPLLRYYCSAGISLGFCAGTIITNLACASMVLFTECILQGWKPIHVVKSRNLWISLGLCLAAFCLTNFYLFLHFSQFQRFIKAMNEYFPAFTSLEFRQWRPYLLEFCREEFHWTEILLIGMGFSIGYLKKDRLVILCSLVFLTLFLQNLVTIRHAPVNARLAPLIAVLCAYGAVHWVEVLTGWKKLLVSLFIISALFQSSFQCLFYRDLHKDPSNLDRAGEWINRNVPAGSTIGAWGGGFAPFEFPAVRFLDYRMVAVPHAHLLDQSNIDPKLLPQYLVLSARYTEGNSVFPNSFVLEKYYETAQSLEGKDSILGFKFGTSMIKTGNWGVHILRRVPS